MTTNWLDLCDEIDDGEFDEGLDAIAKAIESRQGVMTRRHARRMARELKVGDRVMLTNGVMPRFYEGYVGSIKSLRDAAAVVILDELPATRGRQPEGGRSNKVLIPFAHIVKVDEDYERPKTLKEQTPEDEIGDDEEYDDED